jgi:hypothetical protein
MAHAKRFSCGYAAFSAGGEGDREALPGATARDPRAAAIRFGMGKLSGGTGETAISIRTGRSRGPDAAGGRLLVEFLVEFLGGFLELKQHG